LSEYHVIYNGLTEEGLMWVETAGPTAPRLRFNLIDKDGKYACSYITVEEFSEWVVKQAKSLRDFRLETEETIPLS